TPGSNWAEEWPGLLFQLVPRGHAQSNDEHSEVDGAVAVGVKVVEDMFSDLGGISVGEKVGLDLEIVHSQVASGTVIEETLVSLLKLM
ncbi:EF-hand, partial [Pyrenophora tritici-repentis]